MPKILSENRRARFDYEILEAFDAGIELVGQEVKSAKTGRLNLAGSYVIIRGGEAWLINASIPAYQPKNAPADYDEKRARRLLLHHEEIKRLGGKNALVVPLEAYLEKNLVKIKLALARSRKTKDKREVLKKRDAEREMRNG